MMELCGFAYDAEVHCVDCSVKRFGETIRTDSRGMEDSEGNEPSAIFQWSESDTPDHCADCGTFLENALTADGYAYVVDALSRGTGRIDVLRSWWDRYSDGFGDDDMRELAEGWVRYVFPDGLASLTNVDHGALFTFERPTDRDDFTGGRRFGDAWLNYDPWKDGNR